MWPFVRFSLNLVALLIILSVGAMLLMAAMAAITAP